MARGESGQAEGEKARWRVADTSNKQGGILVAARVRGLGGKHKGQTRRSSAWQARGRQPERRESQVATSLSKREPASS